MSVFITVLLFIIGLAVGVGIVCNRAAQTPAPKPMGTYKSDLVDDMFLYGEVTQDDFYRM